MLSQIRLYSRHIRKRGHNNFPKRCITSCIGTKCDSLSPANTPRRPQIFWSGSKTFRLRQFSASVQQTVLSNDIFYLPEDETKYETRREFLMDAFAKQTIENVEEILKVLDTKQTRKGRNINVSRRWQKSIKFERKAYNRWKGLTRKGMNFDDLWEEALEVANIPNPEIIENGLDSYDVVVDGENNNVSPILGLHLDETGRIVDTDSLLDDQDMDVSMTDIDDGLEGDVIVPHKGARHLQTDATLRAIALLSASRVEEWDVFDSRKQVEEIENTDSDEEEESISGMKSPTTSVGIHDLFADMEDGKYMLTTEECNLLLAKLVTSMELTIDTILNHSLELFEHMKSLGYSGMGESGPDAYTFRILMMALNRRLMASGEALKVGKEMLESNIAFTPEAFLNCMDICFARNDLDAATDVLDTVLGRDPTFRPPVDSYICIVEMMKKQNLQTEAFDLLRRTQEMNSLGIRDEIKLLSSLCRWPVRSRRGDLIDTAPLLLKIGKLLERKSQEGKNLDHFIWTTLVDQLSQQAKSCALHWKDVNTILESFFRFYPNYFLDTKLLKTCLEASEALANANLITTALEREAENVPLPDLDSLEGNDTSKVATVPHGVFRRALEICLKSNDTANADRICNAFKTSKEAYPLAVQSEIFGLVLLCYAKDGQAERAKTVLFSMIDEDVDPNEELYGAVLHSLVVDDKKGEAMKMFESMRRDETGLTINPGISCYNAILLGYVRSQSWEDALLLHKAMIEEGISPNPQTTQGLALATFKTNGKTGVLSLLETLLAEDVTIDETTFLLVARMLLPNASGSTDDLRKMLRELGESNETLKTYALELTRSLRTAQVEQNRKATIKHRKTGMNSKEKESWRSALGHLLNLIRVSL